MISTTTTTCKNCETTQRCERDEEGANLETWPCQGSDSCLTRMCQHCLTTCKQCGLPCCAEHLAPAADGSHDLWCAICREGGELPEPVITCQGDAILLAAMAARALGDALTVETLLAAGCSETEARAALSGEGWVN